MYKLLLDVEGHAAVLPTGAIIFGTRADVQWPEVSAPPLFCLFL